MNDRPRLAKVLLACGAAGLSVGCSPHVQSAVHFQKSMDLLRAGDAASARVEYDLGCASAPVNERAACSDRAKRLFDPNFDLAQIDVAPSVASAPAQVAASPAASPAAAPAAPLAVVGGAPQPTAYAVIVGVEHYPSLPSPTGAKADAQKFAEVARRTLGVPPDHVRTLVDGEATRASIERSLEWARASVPASGRVYFFFSGHGSPDPSSGTPYLMPVDADPEYLEQTGILLSAVVGRLGKSKARDVLAVVDSCFSGAGGRSVLPAGARPLVRVKQAVEPKQAPHVAIFSASSGSEISGPSAENQSGAFSKYVTQGLGQGAGDINGDGQVTLKELAEWVGPRVAREAKGQNREQHPSLMLGSDLGDGSTLVVEWGLPAKE